MIKKFVNYTLVLMVFLSCFYFKAGAQNIQAVANLDQTTIRIGDQTKLHLSIEQSAKEQISFPKLTDTLSGKIQIISSSKVDTIRDKNNPNSITVTKSFIITSFDAGSYTIPSFVFTSGTGTLKTNDLMLVVQSVKVDTTKSIYDIKQPLAVSYSFMDWLRDNWLLVVGSLLGILFIAGIIYYLKKRPKNKPLLQVIKPVLSDHTIALNKLRELRSKKLWQQGEIKRYYSELSDVVREYLEKRYKVKTHEKTTDEIFISLKHLDITEENKGMLHQLLVLSDLVKFAKERPLPAENEQSMGNAVDFVLNTQKAEESENIKGGSKGEHI